MAAAAAVLLLRKLETKRDCRVKDHLRSSIRAGCARCCYCTENDKWWRAEGGKGGAGRRRKREKKCVVAAEIPLTETAETPTTATTTAAAATTTVAATAMANSIIKKATKAIAAHTYCCGSNK